MKLKDKVAVITGAGNGIGEAFARRFTAEGARVVVVDIDGAAAERVGREIGGAGIAADVTREAGVQAAADFARRRFGEIDVWFSNAGWAGPREPGELQSDETWDLGWRLHVMAHVYAARAVLPSMTARGEGYLIQTASAVALSIQPEKVAYSVTKHASLALSEWLAAHYRPKGVRVSCFCPSAMLTAMLRANGWPDDHPVMRSAMSPEQVAEVVVRGIEAEDFLILTNAAPLQMLRAKAADYEAWLGGVEAKI